MIEHSDDIVAAEGPERDALEVVNAYMDAFNARDLAGTDATLHFPHVRLASGGVRILEAPGQQPADLFERFSTATGWAYSRWSYRRAIQSRLDKVHFAVQFTPAPRGRQRDRPLPLALGRDPSRRPLGDPGPLQLRALSGGGIHRLAYALFRAP